MFVMIYSCIVVFDQFSLSVFIARVKHPRIPHDYSMTYSNSLDLLGDPIVSTVNQRGCVEL